MKASSLLPTNRILLCKRLLCLCIFNDRKGDTKKDLSSSGSFSKYMQQPELGQAESGAQRTPSRISLGWEGPKCLMNHLLPPLDIIGVPSAA